MSRLAVILSPAAGLGRPERQEPLLRAALTERFEITFHRPQSLTDLDAVVTGLVAGGITHLAVGGGDGTMNRVVNCLRDAPIVLAPLPMGSGNDFCRGVGLGSSMAAALCALLGGGTQNVDLVEVNGVRVCTVAGLGLVAATGLQISHLARPGSLLRPPLRALGFSAYLAAGGARILLHPAITSPARLRWRDGTGAWQTREDRLHGVFLAVRRALGAGLQLPVVAEGNDGRFELVMVHESRRARLLWHLPRLRTGRAIPDDILHVEHATNVEIEWQRGSPLLIDGEDFGHTNRVMARILPGALRVTRAV